MAIVASSQNIVIVFVAISSIILPCCCLAAQLLERRDFSASYEKCGTHTNTHTRVHCAAAAIALHTQQVHWFVASR